ncbi:TPA: XRE family transcriptional regulator [Klebsiella quasipneumoniae]|uniref:XRE family transcriptional regulator n=1 Tax=Klebsiella/Raoultella group TaxID=2890311 RepID=UPI000FDB707E|nr:MULTISPECIES: helix-turn-helix transcriptional regulator [Klebsiella/Raoultella group]HBQ8141536.1 helix-turn-helix transcriptional regulator [Klebsiella pneumoniae]HCI7413124.1 helix-turn-helix transcriptional regulator [Klebsiella pneumoniae subsp. pneumoniae Kp001]HDX8328221.1 helix-turn-helix transcriptional regulator [Raoultella ornithinolytica CD1_MRS_4]MBE8895533.1 helix-turn-helix transcriptional regulator [Klebsiella grimontii]MCU8818363.1 helix-turn-helix transcriptional regulator
MNTLADRLRLAMGYAGTTQSELAFRVGVSQGAIQKLTSGKALSSGKIVDIAKALGVDPIWLSTGEGGMGPAKTPEQRLYGIDPWDKKTPIESDEVEVPYLKDIEFACGDGSCLDDDYNGQKLRFSKATLRKVGANSDGEGVLCFTAHGNSMEPVIADGSTVAINCHDKRIVDGKIYGINQAGWKRLKILYRSGPDKITIRSYNSDEYPDEEVDMDSLEVLGRLFWVSTIF